MRKINEECGVFGVYREEEAPLLTYSTFSFVLPLAIWGDLFCHRHAAVQLLQKRKAFISFASKPPQ